jgi:hypothetical protein
MNSRLKKLSGMTIREVLFRSGRKLALLKERVDYVSGRFDWRPDKLRRHLCSHVSAQPTNENLAEWWLRHMRQRCEPSFLLNTTLLSESVGLYRKLFADRLPLAAEKAERFCRGEFDLLGIHFVTSDPIAWQKDPKTGRRWPSRFFADIDVPFCNGRSEDLNMGDPKHVWELNRHEFLIDCAKAFRLLGDSRYACRVFDLIHSWVNDNPYLQGINWTGPLEVAVRALSWLWAYQLCRGCDALKPDAHLAIIASLYQHGMYLNRHMEFYTSPNNHLIGEATALYLLGCFFPEFDESAAWRHRGWSVLTSEIETQYHADGGSTEQAIFYHNYCLGFFLIAVLTRLQRHEPVPEALFLRLERALDFVMWMTGPDGTVPHIGDIDNSRSIRFEHPPLWDFRNLLSLGAVLFRRGDMKAVAGSFSEDTLWLLGSAGYETHNEITSKVPRALSRAFTSSGYYIMRNGWGPEDHHLCFDYGPIGAGLHTRDIPSSTHGHADMLSFTASCFGKPIIVDGGFYTFSGDPVWHRYFRETQAHNTIRVDGASQAKFNESNAWSCIAAPSPPIWESNEHFDFVECSHAGFYGVKPEVRHRRAVFWNRNDYWLILDRLEGEGEHYVEVFFHFAPGTTSILQGRCGVLIKTNSGVHTLLEAVDRKDLAVGINHGGIGPEGGWIGVSYGRREPAPLVRFHGRLRLPANISFSLIASKTSDLANIRVESMDITRLDNRRVCDGVACRIHDDSRQHIFGFSWGQPDSKRLLRYEFDTRLMLEVETVALDPAASRVLRCDQIVR